MSTETPTHDAAAKAGHTMQPPAVDTAANEDYVESTRANPRRDLFTPPYDQTRALSFDSEHKLRSENIPFDIDVW